MEEYKDRVFIHTVGEFEYEIRFNGEDTSLRAIYKKDYRSWKFAKTITTCDISGEAFHLGVPDMFPTMVKLLWTFAYSTESFKKDWDIRFIKGVCAEPVEEIYIRILENKETGILNRQFIIRLHIEDIDNVSRLQLQIQDIIKKYDREIQQCQHEIKVLQETVEQQDRRITDLDNPVKDLKVLFPDTSIPERLDTVSEFSSQILKGCLDKTLFNHY